MIEYLKHCSVLQRYVEKKLAALINDAWSIVAVKPVVYARDTVKTDTCRSAVKKMADITGTDVIYEKMNVEGNVGLVL